ncbi:hypothetical protein CVT25_008916 [Psilocybe cyanescens]|uniref:Nucleoporin Nup54 alpha-helical domain-containing protein n=1 Tax=Psilocybe cyanescens TaxID=93625 RepID=A0A409XNC6_PSICY|nr:hypothetical protein CVT25_008916 [Psilocybe cyanescens]
MAFLSKAFPSTSAFGMKPATTNTGSIFGSQTQQQQQPTSSIFGGGQNQPQQQQQQPQPASLFSVFGQNNQQNQQQQQQPNQQQTGGLFGQQQQQPQQQPATTGLFGQPQQQQQPAQPTTNIFGQPQQQQQQQPAQPTTNIFGQPQQQQQPTSGLFGQPQQQPQQQQQTGGLFGQPQQQQQPQPQTNLFGGGLFGNNANQQQQTQTGTPNPLQAQGTLPASAFGATTTGTGAFGGFGGGTSLFGAKSQQPQQPALGYNNQSQGTNLITALQNTGGPPPFTKSTKFNDLPEQIQQKLEQIESHIQGRVQIYKDLQQRKLGDEPTKGHEAIRQLKKDLISTATTIRNDLHLSKDLKSKVDQAVEDTIVATRIIDGFRNPQSGNTYLKDHASFPLEYFTRVTDQMKERLTWYKSTIEQIERKLASASGSSQTPQSISATLQAQHSTFLALASKTAAVDAELQKIKVYYTQLWRSKTGSVRDPFNDVVKSNESGNDFGLSGLNVR